MGRSERTSTEKSSELEALRRRVRELEVQDREHHRLIETIRSVTSATASLTGTEFFRTLARQLSVVLGVRCALVGKIIGEAKDRVASVTLYADGRFLDNVEYDLAGTPCWHVVGREMCFYPSGVREAFPEDKLLAEMGIESYLGAPLFDAAGEPLGLICVLHDEVLADPAVAKAVLAVKAPRTGAELERQRAETERRESEERFRLLAENVPGTIYLCRNDERYTMLYLNDAVEALTGYPKEDFLADRVSFVELYHPDDAAQIPEEVNRALIRREPYRLTYRLRHRSGEWRWVQEYGSAISRGEGDAEPALLEGFLADITDRKQAEADRREGEERFRHAFENAAIGVALTSPGGRFIWVNRSFCGMLGYGEGELLERTFVDVTHPDDVASGVEGRDRLLSGEIAYFRTEKRYVCKNGQIKWGKLNVSMMRDAEARPMYAIAEIEDVTARKQAEAELAESVSLLHATLESTADGLLVVDVEGRIVSFNRKFVDMWRIPQEIIASRDDRRAIAYAQEQLKDPEEFTRKIEELYGLPEAQSQDLLEFKDGRVFDRYSMPQKIGGRTVGRVWSFRDITELKRIERVLAETVREERAFREALATLLDISNALAMEPSVDAMCRSAVAVGRERLALDRMGIWFLSEDGEWVEGSYGPDESGGVRDERARRLPVPPDMRELLSAESPVTAVRTEDVPLYNDGGEIVGRGMHLLAPMWDGQRIIGFITADNLLAGRPISDRDTEILALYSATVGHLCSRKRIERKLAETVHEERALREGLATLLDISNELAMEPTVDAMCRSAVESGLSRLGIDRLGIWFLSEDRQWAEGSYGTDEAGHVRDEREERIPLRSETRRILASENRFAAIRSDDVPLHNNRGEVVGRGTHLLAPMWDGQKIIGFICADNLLSGRTVSERDAAIIALYGATVGHRSSRKRVEEALSESQNRLRGVIEAVPVVLTSVEAITNKFLLMIGDVRRLFGYDVERFYADPDFGATLVHPDDASYVYRGYRDGLASGRPFNLEFRIIHGEHGRAVWLYQRVVPILGEDGRLVRHDNVAADITERKEAEEALRRSEERYRTLVEMAPEAIVVVDTETLKFVDANENAVRMFGLPREGLLEVGPIELSPAVQPDGRSSLESARTKILEARSGRLVGFEWTHRSADGREFPCEVRIIAMSEPDQHLLRGSITDISERKRAEEERQQLERQLLQAQKLESIGTLAGGIAHDFNNLLAVILGQASVHTRDRGLPEKVRDSLRDIVDASERGSALTHQLLAYARGGLQKPAPTDLNQVVGSVLQILTRTTPSRIELVCRLGADVPAIMADATQIEQVVMNLCLNAIQASEAPARVEVITTSEALGPEAAGAMELEAGRFVLLQVRDHGCGMDGETAERIFEPFFTTKPMGRGMGLAAAMGIVKSHHGQIRVDSAPGEGTTMSVWLPCSTAAAVAPPRPASKRMGPPRGSETILVADDDVAITRTVEQVLGSVGYVVVSHTDADETIAFLDTNSEDIDLVVLDLHMPKRSAEQMFREIRRRCPDVPVLLASGFDEPAQVCALLQEGAAGFVRKPFSLMTLATAVRDALDAGERAPK